jgi:hypothetical protein
MSIEAYVCAVGRQREQLEEQIVIGEDGPEVTSRAPYHERLER